MGMSMAIQSQHPKSLELFELRNDANVMHLFHMPEGINEIHLYLDIIPVEPLFDFDYTKTLVLLFLIKLLSISEMNLTLKAKTSFKVLKIQHLGDGFESLMDRI